MFFQVLLRLLAKEQLCQGGIRIVDGKGAGALCTASVTALAVAADTSFCLQASLTALLPGRLRRVELCRGANIIKTAVQNDFLLKGSATMNKEFSDSLWQFFCLLSSILLSDLVVPRPPGKSVRISNVFVDRNTTDNIRYANQSAQARERSQKLPGCHFAPHGLPAGSTPRCP